MYIKLIFNQTINNKQMTLLDCTRGTVCTLHSGGSVCLANLGGSCLHSGGSWRPGDPSLLTHTLLVHHTYCTGKFFNTKDNNKNII